MKIEQFIKSQWPNGWEKLYEADRKAIKLAVKFYVKEKLTEYKNSIENNPFNIRIRIDQDFPEIE